MKIQSNDRRPRAKRSEAPKTQRVNSIVLSSWLPAFAWSGIPGMTKKVALSLSFVTVLAACPGPKKNVTNTNTTNTNTSTSQATNNTTPPPASAPVQPAEDLSKKYPGYMTTNLPPILGKPLENLTIKPLDAKPIPPKQVKLKNGMIIYVTEDQTLPLVDVAVLTDVGSVYAPQGKEGLTDLLAAAWRTGGTSKRSGDVLDKELEDRAADMGVSIGAEAASVRMDLMARDLDWGIKLLAEVVMSPALPDASIELERLRLSEEVMNQDDNPGSVVYNIFNEQFFGTDNPWGRRPTVESISGLTKKDLLDFYTASFHPQRTRVIISGNLKADEAVKMIEKAFSTWKPKLKPLPKVTAPKTLEKTKVIYIEMSLPQSTFLLGVPTTAGRKHPDQEVLSVFNDILGGGGFDSLLMEEIRSNRGLAYGVSSDLEVAADFGGVLNIVGQTKAESTVESIRLALDILEKTRSGAMIKEDNVARAKDATLNSFVFRFVSPFSLALQTATYELFGFAPDYMAKLPEKIKGIDKEQLVKAANASIDNSKILLIVVGNKKRFDKPLSALGLGEPEVIPAPNLKFKP